MDKTGERMLHTLTAAVVLAGFGWLVWVIVRANLAYNRERDAMTPLERERAREEDRREANIW